MLLFFLFSIPGFSFDRDPQLYFDDTCVVPERLEGKTENTIKNINLNPRYCMLLIKSSTVDIFWDTVQSFDCSWCIMNSKSTSQWPSGRNVSPHCGRGGEQCWLTLFFFTLSPSASLFLYTLSSCCFPPLPLAGKVKQEPSVYRDGPPYQRRGSLQLWQFLVTLLDDPANGHFIAWTGRGMEFKLIEPEEVSPHCPQLFTSIHATCCNIWVYVVLILSS